MSRWVDLDACPCNKCLIKQDCITHYNGQCKKYIAWKQGVYVQPVKHGHWIHKVDDVYRCSSCDMPVHVAECMGKPMFACCPFCKTDMDEVSE